MKEKYHLSGQDSVGSSILSEVYSFLYFAHWLARTEKTLERKTMIFFCNE